MPDTGASATALLPEPSADELTSAPTALPDPSPSSSRHPGSWGRAAALAVGFAGIQALLLVLTVWPAVRVDARHVPLAVAGPPAAVTAFTAQLDAHDKGAFDVRGTENEETARQLITERKVHGAVVFGPQGPQILTASADGPAIKEMLAKIGGRMTPNAVPVHDVVPTPHDDPHAGGLMATVIVLFFVATAFGGLLAVLMPGERQRWVSLAVFLVASALSSAALLGGWINVIGGSYLGLTGVLMLTALAAALPTWAWTRLLGLHGIGLGFTVMLQLAPAYSGAVTGPEMLPEPWGTVGAFFPPGAFVDLARSVAYFDGIAGTRPLAVLLGWSALGGLLLVAARRRPRAPARSS